MALPSSSSSTSDKSPTSPVIMSSAFLKAHCLADGQLTPPDSPPSPRAAVPRHVPRLHLPKLLRKRAPNKRERHPTQTATIAREQPFIPYRSEPLPLVLPDSPNETDCSSTSTVSPVSPPGLRRVSASYSDLRSLAAEQASGKTPSAVTSLLPSPIPRDEGTEDGPSFQPDKPGMTETKREYQSYSDLHILSWYCDEAKTPDINEIEEAIAATDDIGPLPEPVTPNPIRDGDSTDEGEFPITPTDDMDRLTYASSESDWLANTKSHDERLRRFKARCYQIVQHPVTSPLQQPDDDEIMLATVLVGPGKPRLVQISRPPSASTNQGSHRSQKARPETPRKYTQEVSAFSPYDTPGGSIEPFPELQIKTPSPKANYSSISLVPAPLAFVGRERPSSSQSASTVFTSTLHRLKTLAEPFGYTPSNVSTQTVSTSAWPIPPSYSQRERDRYQQPARPSTPRLPPSPIPTTANTSSALRQSRILDAITAAIDRFPDGILRLDSPCIQELRASHIPDAIYIDALQRIFPHAPVFLLSALAAWLLVDLYFLNTLSNCDNHLNTPYSTTENAGLPSRMLSRSRRQQNIASQHSTLSALVLKSNSSLHRIPARARDLLGLTTSATAPSLQTEDSHWLARVKVVSYSVHVIGQKLVEELRENWDEDIWRSLRVLVEVIEGVPVARGDAWL